MRYRVKSGVLPIDTITRFIVRHHDDIEIKNEEQIVWRRGVSLIDKSNANNKALVIEDGLEIRLYVKGNTAIDYLDILRDTLNEIFKGYKSDYPELEYVISDNNNKLIYESDKTIWINFKHDHLYLTSNEQMLNMAAFIDKYAINYDVLHSLMMIVLKKFIDLNLVDDKNYNKLKDYFENDACIDNNAPKSKKSKFMHQILTDIASVGSIYSAFYLFINNNPEIPLYVNTFIKWVLSFIPK